MRSFVELFPILILALTKPLFTEAGETSQPTTVSSVINKAVIKMKNLVFFIIFPNYSLTAYFLAYNTTMTEKLKRFK